jgi:hypothetical protein
LDVVFRIAEAGEQQRDNLADHVGDRPQIRPGYPGRFVHVTVRVSGLSRESQDSDWSGFN